MGSEKKELSKGNIYKVKFEDKDGNSTSKMIVSDNQLAAITKASRLSALKNHHRVLLELICALEDVRGVTFELESDC